MRFKAVLFDLDGTLLDTLEDIARSMNAVLMSAGFSPPPVEAYRRFIGEGIANLVRRAMLSRVAPPAAHPDRSACRTIQYVPRLSAAQ